MIRNVERAWFEVWGSEQAQNRVLKGLLALITAIVIVESVGLVLLSLRTPTIVTVSHAGSKWFTPGPLKADLAEAEIRHAVLNYIELRHNWDWSKIESKLKLAANYVDPSALKTFVTQTAPQIKLAKERKISQKLYIDPNSININLKNQTVGISGDRILIVETLRATNVQTFELTFKSGPRTPANPEGIYVSAEKRVAIEGDATTEEKP